MPGLMGKLRARTSVSARMLEFTVLCASRVNEVVLARGCEFDLANARWNIPGDRMKGGRQHVVMLSQRAVEIVRERHPDGQKPNALVFGVTGAALTKMLALAGYGDATVHGTARASFKTWADEATSFRDAVSEACPHRGRQGQGCIRPRGIRAATRRADGNVVAALLLAASRCVKQRRAIAHRVIASPENGTAGPLIRPRLRSAHEVTHDGPCLRLYTRKTRISRPAAPDHEPVN
jgi:integrase